MPFGKRVTVVNTILLSTLVLSVGFSLLAAHRLTIGNYGISTFSNPGMTKSDAGVDFSRTAIPIPPQEKSSDSGATAYQEQRNHDTDDLNPATGHALVVADPDANADPLSSEGSQPRQSGTPVDAITRDTEMGNSDPINGASQNTNHDSALQSYYYDDYYHPVYDSSPFILPITWGAVAGTLMWRGKVRSAWCKQGYDYDTFRLMARMRGSPIRVKLLNNITTAKNRLQLAKEFGVDWKTIDNHIELLARNGLIREMTVVGTYRYYIITEHGKRILALLAALAEPESQLEGQVAAAIN